MELHETGFYYFLFIGILISAIIIHMNTYIKSFLKVTGILNF